MVGNKSMSQTPVSSERFIVVQKDGYEVELEYNKDFAILHLPYVDKMSKSTYMDMKTSLAGFMNFIKVVGYSSLWAAIKPEDELMTKFVGKMGFEYRGQADNLAVYERTS